MLWQARRNTKRWSQKHLDSRWTGFTLNTFATGAMPSTKTSTTWARSSARNVAGSITVGGFTTIEWKSVLSVPHLFKVYIVVARITMEVLDKFERFKTHLKSLNLPSDLQCELVKGLDKLPSGNLGLNIFIAKLREIPKELAEEIKHLADHYYGHNTIPAGCVHICLDVIEEKVKIENKIAKALISWMRQVADGPDDQIPGYLVTTIRYLDYFLQCS
eukprot:TRINITY_DN9916_c0_g1_i1.p1 TRINITY_DN9916_c0_g1~~TRINITY_DN9916_c0_g1_i1.p1  ORF type:complete len:217 (-),score=9.15 TRINITY_DN9916_c0_g1_i1:390-1040(-)